MSTITVVIPNWNGLHLLRPCCESLWATTGAGELRVLVIDNGSTDGSVAWLDGMAAEGRLDRICNVENLGFAKATNQGVRASSGDVLFLNNDIVALPGWLPPLRAALAEDPRIAGAGSLLLYPGGRLIQHAGVRIGRIDGRMKVYHRGHYRTLESMPEARIPDLRSAVTAACLLLRRQALDQVGLLDEGFVNGYEDVDLCLRLGAAGWKLAYRGDSVLEHHESVTKGRHDAEASNQALCFQRWESRIDPEVVDASCRAEMQENDRRRRFLANPRGVWNIRRMVSLLRRRGAHREAELWKRLSGRRLFWWFLRPDPLERIRLVRAIGYPEVEDRV